MYKYILFDLDGTVADSAEGVINSVYYALCNMGFEVSDKASLKKFIGPPLSSSFKEFYNFDEKQIDRGIKLYREYYTDKGINEACIYDGIKSLLRKLKSCGKKVILATSKPEVFAVRIIENFGVSDCFDVIAGSTLDEERNTKAKVIKYALDKAGVSDLSDVLMIGDRKHDVLGANDIGIKCAYILYGYGNLQEAIEYHADYIIDTVDNLENFLLKGVFTMERIIAKDLLSINAVFLRPQEPFTWASGIKSPIYCDNRLTLSAPRVRDDVENALARVVEENYPECEVLMGTSTAGIAHAAITATILNLPMGYVRSGAKDHGRGNQIEGKLEKGQKVVVIEDLISTGGSVIEVVNALRDAGAEVLGIASIFTYGMQKGIDRLNAANVKNISLTNLDVIADVAAEQGYIKPEDKEKLIKFRNNPSDESWIGEA